MQISLSSSPCSLPACDLSISMAAPTMVVEDTQETMPAQEQLPGPVRCSKCMLQVCKEDAQQKGPNSWWCKPCNRLSALLARSIALPDALRNLEDEERVAFWRKASSSLEGGRLSYAAVRKVMQDTLTSEYVRQSKRSVKGPFQPLSVWAVQGFDTDLIEQKGECMDHEARPSFFPSFPLTAAWPLATHARRCWARCTAVRSCTWRRSRFSGPWSRSC